MDWLTRCVPEPDAFFSGHWRKEPVVLRPDSPPVDVLTVAEVDRLLDAGSLATPYAQLVHEESVVAPERFCLPRVVLGEIVERYVDAGSVRRIVAEERATLLLRYVDQWHAGVRDLADGLAERFGRQVEAFYFLTPPGTQGRPVHRDDADILAVQIHGAKRWRVYGGPADGEWQPERAAGDLGDPLLDTVLGEGEVLYVPRAFAHCAVAVGDTPSAHLSLTVREAGTAQLYALARALLLTGDEIAPRPNDDASLHTAAAGLLAHFRATLAELTPEELVELARETMRTERPSPGRPLSDLIATGPKRGA
ncbi:cupin domain-containing protein [Streptomyces sp. NPDC001787]|uniref:JmjC domain-containing protein n=1 Tax=Streptomyces sp. NPDC001787 TaxID=3154523 RepID=UPI003317F21C